MNIFGVSSLSPFGSSASKPDNEKGSRESFADLLSKMSEAKQPTTSTSGGSGAQGAAVDSASAYHEKLQLLRDRVEQIMSQLGIDTSDAPLTMQLNANGELIVNGEHSQKADLQKAISSDPAIKELFTQVATLAEKIAKTENPDGIQTLLNANDPESLSSISLPERFSLKIDGTNVEPTIG